MTADEAEFERKNISRTPRQICRNNKKIKQVIKAIGDGSFSDGDKSLFTPLVDSLMDRNDPFLLVADLESYIECQQTVSEMFLDQEGWTGKAILNVARMGKFSTDRTIRQYSEEIWGIPVEE
jgi:starch phosphorylase